MPHLDPHAAYESWAATYDDVENHTVALAQRALAAMVPMAPWRVVELGCGTGRMLEQLRDAGAVQPIGVDFSAAMLARAAARLPKVRLVQADLKQPIPLRDGCADLVLLSLVLEHIADAAPVVVEAHRLLAPGGRLIVLELHEAAFGEGRRATFRDADGIDVTTTRVVHDAPSLDALARAAGFAPGQFHTWERNDQPRLLAGAWLAQERAPRPITDLSPSFYFFRSMDDPFFNVCVDLDAAAAKAASRARGASFFLVTLHAAMRAIHAVPELRLRLVDDAVMHYPRVMAGCTVMHPDERFGFAYMPYHDDFRAFAASATAALDAQRANPSFDVGDHQDVVHVSAVPWMHFRSITHARSHRTGVSVPKLVFGEVVDGRLPVSLEVHHALVDGLHVGRFFQWMQRALTEWATA